MEDKLVQGSMLRSDIRQGFGISFLFAVAGIVICLCFDSLDIKGHHKQPSYLWGIGNAARLRAVFVQQVLLTVTLSRLYRAV